ncbi:uncharacterized protein LOC121367422 [Gigantopelta aegis]|uniref:uncharacterized protein LOC121367422 n=1 Tax=Gigantopelta aegis TaxID=1735272 RepID=UPI001B88AC06|nr:uncharacterized protein LOC121367422 [Gigantopelta aegis]
MFRKNVISTRELLSDNFIDRNDTRNSSSELSQHSQFDFSQINTQDMFTQHSSGSQPEPHSIFPGKRLSFYDKWKAKLPSQHPVPVNKSLKNCSGPLTSNISEHRQTPTYDVPFQQQVQMNKAKAKERDERDLLQQVINTVQDCAKEMKFTLHSVKEKLEYQHDHSGEKIEQTISTFLEDLCKYQDKMFESVLERDANSSKVHSLEVDIAAKDTKIITLEKVLEGLQMNCPESVVKAIHVPNQRLELQVQQILDRTKENTDTQTSQFMEHKKLTEQQMKQCDHLYQTQEELLHKIENRVLDEMATLQRELKRKDTSYKRECNDQLRSFQENNIRETESLIQRLFEQSSHMSFEQKNEFKTILKGELQAISRKQLNNFENFFQDKLNNYFYNQEKRIVEMFSQMSSILENKENAQPDKETGSFLSLPQFEERMGCWNEDFKKQLEKLHREHMAEINRLQVNMSKESSNSLLLKHQNTPAFCSPVLPLTNDKGSETFQKWTDKTTLSLIGTTNSDKEAHMQRHESFGFSDLGAGQFNTKSLFSRPVFSPVATVLPQRKQVQIAGEENSNYEKSNFAEVKPMQTKSMMKKKRKKKNSIYSKKRKPKPITALCKTMHTTELPQNNITDRTRSKSAILLDKRSESCPLKNSKEESVAVKGITTTKQPNLSVYDFSGEEDSWSFQPKMITQNKACKNNPGNRYLTSRNKQFKSPEISFEDCSSRTSSPSLSITEMVIRRKIRCKKDSPSIDLQFDGASSLHHFSTSDETIGDILSTPNMLLYNERRQWNFQQNFMQRQHQESKVFRRSGEKRKLCDFNFDSRLGIASLLHKKLNSAINTS